MSTIIDRLAAFATETRFDDLPADVLAETKRVLLDSVGCALAGIDELKGRIGIEYGRLLGGNDPSATIIGAGERTSIFGAAFANSELINALDYDVILPPGHVSPYVLPPALAVGESKGVSGRDLIVACAIAHEISFRIGKAMDYLRDIKDGKIDVPPVYGFASTIFGATAAAARLRGLPREVLANALGIAGNISTVNPHVAWMQHAPTTTIKYLLGGHVAQSALTASFMAELGHRGDSQMLDDREYGYPRLIGTKRWESERITDAIGKEWGFASALSYKPYPHCRNQHALFGAMTKVLEENDIKVEEIDGIHAWVEAFMDRPCWLNQVIEYPHDAQFSIAHGIALAAHRVPPGKAWTDPALVFSPSVMALMKKVTHQAHPDYVRLRALHPASQPAHVEIKARGRTFIGERSFPKGSRSPDPSTYMTDDEIVAKFAGNASHVLTRGAIDEIVDTFMNLERSGNVQAVMRKLWPESADNPQDREHERVAETD